VEINRVKDQLGEQPEPDPQLDFYWVDSRFTEFAVSRATAMSLERQLVSEPVPVWVTFRDLAGARHRLRAALIERISESTVAQRIAMREFHRARRKERNADKDWENDESF
jgi:hypothetical protein